METVIPPHTEVIQRLRSRAPEVSSLQTCSEIKMKRNIFLATLSLVLLFGYAANSSAQVKQVEMHIAGYLCGN